jgi:hypothetical protein
LPRLAQDEQLLADRAHLEHVVRQERHPIVQGLPVQRIFPPPSGSRRIVTFSAFSVISGGGLL